MPRIVPNLWFDTEALEAAEFYVSVFPNSNVNNVNRYGPDAPMPEGTVLTVDFELDGTRFTAINGGPQFTFSEAVSFVIDCADQAEVDYYWDRLCDGGQPDQCGWLTGTGCRGRSYRRVWARCLAPAIPSVHGAPSPP